MIRYFTFVLLLLMSASPSAFAQDRPDARQSSPAPAVTVSVSANGVRFAALGGVRQIRLEVFGAADAPLYNSDLRAGNVLDWRLEDGKGARLPDGSYLCVVTVRDVSGRLGMRQGTVVVQGGEPSLQMGEVEQSGSIETERALSTVSNDAAGAVTLMAHDGSDGQVVSTRGGLSFRSGDFFFGRDRELMRLTPEGRVGIGIDKPEATLDVAGTIRARGGIRFEDGSVLSSAGRAPVGSSGTFANAAAEGVTALSVSGTGTTNQLAKWADNVGTLGSSSITEVNGAIGFGITNPLGGMHIKAAGGFGAENPDGTSQATKVPLLMQADSTVLGFLNGSGRPAFAINLDSNLGTTSARGVVTFYDKYDGNWHASMTLKNGNVGFGTNAPLGGLHIKAAGGFSAENADGTSQLSAVPLLIQGDRTVLGFLNGSGRQAFAVNLDNNQGTTNARGVVTFYDKYDGQWHASMTLRNGNIGVGTAAPSSKLDVAGDLKVSGDAVVNGNIAAKYQDVAEWVDADEEMRPGTVVTIDPVRVNAVKPSGRAYDTHVAGIVSERPGLILGEGGEGKALVATTGRVKVRVDATRRPIRVGDLLVTSGRPGVAMRSVPVAAGRARIHRPGTIIGKALEPLAGGEGEILVLLSMQ